MTEKFSMKVGGLWKVKRPVEVPCQGTMHVDTFGIVTSAEYDPYHRKDGSTLDRWNIKFLTADKLFEIPLVGKVIWTFYFESMEDECT